MCTSLFVRVTLIFCLGEAMVKIRTNCNNRIILRKTRRTSGWIIATRMQLLPNADTAQFSEAHFGSLKAESCTGSMVENLRPSGLAGGGIWR